MPDQLPILRWMQGTGNRFALVNQSELQGWKPSMLAQVLGSGDRDLDGLLVLEPQLIGQVSSAELRSYGQLATVPAPRL